MYVPVNARIDDAQALYALIDTLRFATVVSAVGEAEFPFASHVPLMLDRERRQLRGHFAAANPHCAAVAARLPVLAVFLGPHTYVSPRWYASAPAVPTWNYTAVHVQGRFRPLTQDELLADLATMVTAHEGDPLASGAITERFRAQLLALITGFAIDIDAIEGKRKLGQHRSQADQAGVRQALVRTQGESYAAQFDPAPHGAST